VRLAVENAEHVCSFVCGQGVDGGQAKEAVLLSVLAAVSIPAVCDQRQDCESRRTSQEGTISQ